MAEGESVNAVTPGISFGAQVPIADLSPELPDVFSKSIKAVVTLKWPYSSSNKTVALLLAEPDFRLRRLNGQVRVQFTGSSAKTLARSDISSGDEVVLSLRGVEWIKESESLVRTPGKGVDWELRFGERLILQIDNNETRAISIVDIDHPPPSPEPEEVSSTGLYGDGDLSQLSQGTPIPATHRERLKDRNKWSSPAFIKRARLSYGSLFGEDPFSEEDGSVPGKGRKRSRRSSSWRYQSRSPSPESEDSNEPAIDKTLATPARPVVVMTDEGCQTMDFDDDNGFRTSNGFGSQPRSLFQSEVASPSPAFYFGTRPQQLDSPQFETPRSGQWIDAQSQTRMKELDQPLQTPNFSRTDAGTSPSRPSAVPFATGATQTSPQQVGPQSGLNLPRQTLGQQPYSTFGTFTTLDPCAAVSSPHEQDRSLSHDIEENKAISEEAPSFHQNDLPLPTAYEVWQNDQDIPESAFQEADSYNEIKPDPYDRLDYDMHSTGPYFTTGDGQTEQEIRTQGQIDTPHKSMVEADSNLLSQHHDSLQTLGSAALSARDNQTIVTQDSRFADESNHSPAIKTGTPRNRLHEDDSAEESDTEVIDEVEHSESGLREHAQGTEEEAEFEDDEAFEGKEGHVASDDQDEEEEESDVFVPTDRLGNPLPDDFYAEYGWRRGGRDQYGNPLPYDKEEDYDEEEDQSDGDVEGEEYEGESEEEEEEEVDDASSQPEQKSAPVVIDLLSSDDEEEPETKPQDEPPAKENVALQTHPHETGASYLASRDIEDTGMEDEDESMEREDNAAESGGDLGEESNGNVDEDESMEEDDAIMDTEGEILGDESDGIVDEDESMEGEDIQDDPVVDEQTPQPDIQPSRTIAKEEKELNDEQAVDEEEEEEEIEAADKVRGEDGHDQEQQFKSSEMVEDDEEEEEIEAQDGTKASVETNLEHQSKHQKSIEANEHVEDEEMEAQNGTKASVVMNLEQHSKHQESVEADEHVEVEEIQADYEPKYAENQNQEQHFKSHGEVEDSPAKEVVHPASGKMEPQYDGHSESIDAAHEDVENSHSLEDNLIKETQTSHDQDSMDNKELKAQESRRPTQDSIEEDTQIGYDRSSMEDDESGSVSTEAFSWRTEEGNASDDQGGERKSKRGRRRKRYSRRSLSEKEYEKSYRPDGMDKRQIRFSGTHEYELRKDPSEPQVIKQGDEPNQAENPLDEDKTKAILIKGISKPDTEEGPTKEPDNQHIRPAYGDYNMEDAGPLPESTSANVNKAPEAEAQTAIAAEEDAPAETHTVGNSLILNQATNFASTNDPESDKIQEHTTHAKDGDIDVVMGEATTNMEELQEDDRPLMLPTVPSTIPGASEPLSSSKYHNNDLRFDGASDAIGPEDTMQFEIEMKNYNLRQAEKSLDGERSRVAEPDIDDFHDAQETIIDVPHVTEQPEEPLDIAVDSARRERRSKTPIPPVERAEHALEHEAHLTTEHRPSASISNSESVEYLQPGYKPSSLTVPRLRSILGSHSITYPSGAKKAQLVEIFIENIVPQAEVATTNASQDNDTKLRDEQSLISTLRVERAERAVGFTEDQLPTPAATQATQGSPAVKRSDSKHDTRFYLDPYEPSSSGVIEEVMEASSSLRSNTQRGNKVHKLQPGEASKLKKGVAELEQLVSSTRDTLETEKQAEEKETDANMTVEAAEEFVIAPEEPAVQVTPPRTRLAARRAVTPLLAASEVVEAEMVDQSSERVAQPDITTPNVLQSVPRTRRALSRAATPLATSGEKENNALRQRSETVDSVKTSIEQDVLSTNNSASVPRTRAASKRAMTPVPTIIETVDDKMETDEAERSVVASQASHKPIKGDAAETSNTLTPTPAVRTRSAARHEDAENIQHEGALRSDVANPSVEKSEDPAVAPTTPPRTRSGFKYGLATAKGGLQSKRSPPLVVEGHESPEGDDVSAELASAAFESPTKPVTRTKSDRTSLNAALGVKLSRAINTDHGVFSRLKQLKQNLGKRLDVLAIVTSTPTEPEKAKKAPKHFHIKFNVTDASIGPANVTEIQVFRPYENALPIVQVGDGILLRNFVVRSEKGKGFALRSETNEGSSWAVFKSDETVDIRGPPVEYAAGEEENMAELKTWYDSLDATARNRLDRANAAKPSTPSKATSTKVTPTKPLAKM